MVLEVMREVGIDHSTTRPQKLTEELVRGAALLITMGCGEECPYISGLRRLDWPLADPKGRRIEEVRAIRDEARRRVIELIQVEEVRP
jgi:protein-tyrosine-phosphatase